MLKKILIGLVVFVLLFVAVVALQPAGFSVSRSATMAAPPAVVFAQVNDFHKWENWSPWAKLDPNATATFEGPEQGKGASFSWAGNDEVGAGRMTIIDSQPDEQVRIRLEFTKPFTATNTTDFTFRPVNQGTQVTWTMSGERNFMGKLVCMFMDMDTMVGGQFEQGLASMKSIAEEEAPAEHGTQPGEHSTVPAEQNSVPAEQNSVPANGSS